MSLTDQDFEDAAASLGCPVKYIKAVAQVEAPKGGFLPDGRATLLFEAHIFSKQTGHRFDAGYPQISSRTWNRTLYKGGAAEYDRQALAAALDRRAALRSASYGKFQIMGFNHAAAGYDTVDAFVLAMGLSEKHHLDAFVAFLKSQKLDAPLREGRWADFARKFNGPGFAENQYDVKLAKAAQ